MVLRDHEGFIMPVDNFDQLDLNRRFTILRAMVKPHQKKTIHALQKDNFRHCEALTWWWGIQESCYIESYHTVIFQNISFFILNDDAIRTLMQYIRRVDKIWFENVYFGKVKEQ
jgi:hypothetical protein